VNRRPRLLFYLAGWLLGGVSMGIAAYIDAARMLGAPRPLYVAVVGLPYFILLVLLWGAPFLLLGTYVLRRAVKATGARSPYAWAGMGRVLGPILLFIWAMAFWGLQRMVHMSDIDVGLLSSGTTALVENHSWWIVIPAGAVASYLLCHVERRLGNLSAT